jgi:plastocyanin
MSKSLLHGVTFALLAAVAAACGEPEAEAPPEQPRPQGVYGVAPAAVGGTPSAITLTPAMDAGSARAARPDGQDPPVMDQLGLVFTPPTLFARVGEPVVFTNSETLVHNVRLTVTDTDSTVFDVETDPGARAEFVFERGGGYDVTCDHHPGMRAFIYATDAPYAVFADITGNFLIPDVPPGTYTLSVWSVNPNLRAERRLEVSGPSTEVNLVAP